VKNKQTETVVKSVKAVKAVEVPQRRNPQEVIAALDKVLKSGPLTKSGFNLTPIERVSLSTEEVKKIQLDLTEVQATVQDTNKQIQRALGTGASAWLEYVERLPLIGKPISRGIDKRRKITTKNLVSQMKETNTANLERLAQSQVSLVSTSQKARAFADTIDTLLETIKLENWTVSEIENALTLLSGNKLDNRATVINSYVESIISPENVEAEKAQLMRQIEAIKAQTVSSIKAMNSTVLILRSVNREVAVASAATTALAEPAIQLEEAATKALSAEKDTLVIGQGILEIFKNAANALNCSVDAIHVLQEKGLASPESVQKLEATANMLVDKANELPSSAGQASS